MTKRTTKEINTDNPYKVNGKPILQFQPQAEMWDECVEWLKVRGYRITPNTWAGDIGLFARQLAEGKNGYLVFIKEE